MKTTIPNHDTLRSEPIKLNTLGPFREVVHKPPTAWLDMPILSSLCFKMR